MADAVVFVHTSVHFSTLMSRLVFFPALLQALSVAEKRSATTRT